MKILVTGSKGQLGYDVINELLKRGHNPIGADIEEMDITDKQEVTAFCSKHEPEAVIHCAAYTAVDAAEDNKELCMAVNVDGTKNIAEFCKEKDIKMIFISTDYVFNGEGDVPWETNDKCEPLSVYGISKYQGEKCVADILDKYFIVRISWAFGKNGNNFIKKIIEKSYNVDELNVVDDQVGSPTYTEDLAVLLCDMIESEEYGYYHATNEGFCSWYELTCEALRVKGITTKVNPINSNMFKSKAKRPANSRMSKDELEKRGFKKLPEWKDAVRRYLQ